MAVSLLAVRHQLLVTMIAHIATRVLTLIDLLKRMPSVVLSPVTARIEAFVTEVALEGLLAGVYPLMHLVVGFGIKCSIANFLNSYNGTNRHVKYDNLLIVSIKIHLPFSVYLKLQTNNLLKERAGQHVRNLLSTSARYLLHFFAIQILVRVLGHLY